MQITSLPELLESPIEFTWIRGSPMLKPELDSAVEIIIDTEWQSQFEEYLIRELDDFSRIDPLKVAWNVIIASTYVIRLVRTSSDVRIDEGWRDWVQFMLESICLSWEPTRSCVERSTSPPVPKFWDFTFKFMFTQAQRCPSLQAGCRTKK